MEPVRLENTFRLSSTPCALWPHVSNTDRLNRALGLPATTTSSVDPADFSRQVSARLLGFPLSWREAPFDYVDSRHYEVTRDFHSGPFARFQGGLRLAAEGGGTEATLYGAFWPRAEWSRPLVKLFARKAMRDMRAMYARIDESVSALGTCPAPPRTVTPADETLFEARAGRLREASAEPKSVARLLEHLRSAPDDEVRGMRPYELADRWGVERRCALSACLRAVRAGLLDLQWEVLCPNCAAPKESHSSLSGLKNTAHCGTCQVEYGVDLAKSVELRFTVHPSVRGAQAAVFCAGSPAHSRHALAQLRLDGGAVRPVVLELEPRPYTVRSLLSKRTVRLRPAPCAAQTLSVDFATAADGDELEFRPGPVKLNFQPTLEPALARVEKESWKEAAATAEQITALQEFRDLFSSDVLAPGVEIGIKNLALLFTDLKGSTAMYERVGDAAAYGVVRDHFGWLTGIVAARGGAVVKTIGDAVMAVFPAGSGALEAALDMQERIGELGTLLSPREPVVLKIGVHQGPSIAINAGGSLDYFGTMVNIAARVQSESAGGDVVITCAIAEDPACRRVLEARGPACERFAIALKGLSGEFELRRLTPRVPLK